jgi:phenylalanine ammonia-lyase
MENSTKNGKRTETVPHASVVYSQWAALQSRLGSAKHVLVNGRDLTIADVVAVSL